MDAFRCKIGAKMPEVLFTERFLSKARPIAGEVTTRYWDTACRGLWVHVGKRTVTFYAKAGSRDYKIGHYSGWTLYEARERCQEIRRKVVAGEDPWPIRQSVQTVREAFDDFENVRLAKRRESTRFEYRRQMELYVFRKWGDKSVDRFTRADVIDLHSELSKAESACAPIVYSRPSAAFMDGSRRNGVTQGQIRRARSSATANKAGKPT